MNGLPFSIEVCVTNFDDAQQAYLKGAARLEICVSLETEGLTPPPELIEKISEHIPIPFRILLRETPEGFEFTTDHISVFKKNVQVLSAFSPEGWVLGFLKNGNVDIAAMDKIFTILDDRPITFHKAIDSTDDILHSIEIIQTFPGIDTILTSGGKETAWEGRDVLFEMQKHFSGHIMAGGRITSEILPELYDATQLKWYHGKRIL